MIEQTRFLSTVFLCNELKLVNIYSGANVCGRNVCGIFLGGGTTVFLRIAGKSAKIRTRKNFVPHNIANLSKLCFVDSLSLFLRKTLKKIVRFVGEKFQRT